MKKANAEIRAMMQERKIPVWQIAHCMGVHENTVLRHLRLELPEQDKQAMKRIIEALVAEQTASAE